MRAGKLVCAWRSTVNRINVETMTERRTTIILIQFTQPKLFERVCTFVYVFCHKYSRRRTKLLDTEIQRGCLEDRQRDILID